MSNDFIQNAVNALYQSNELMALKAENARLKAEVERVGMENAHLHKGIYSLSLNVAQLKAEVERLTKAGDAMVLWIRNCPDSRLFDDETVVEAWNAAKGVQS